MRFSRLATVTSVWFCSLALLHAGETKNVILVSADGLRSEELFAGFDRSLVEKPDSPLVKKYHLATPEQRRTRLLPFFWREFGTNGVIIGNRSKGSTFRLRNPHRFSYPGYAEILTGQYLEAISSNDPVRIPRETVLEYVARQLSLPPTGVALFGAWDILYYAAAKTEGAITANSGYKRLPPSFEGSPLAEWDRLQFDILTPWDSVRDDAVTFNLALEYLKLHKPRLLYIALGQPDDWSHDGRYDRALQSIEHLDRCLQTLWTTLQSLPEYRGNTTLIVTTDHGRGTSRKSWKSHGKDVKGAEYVWLATLGPDTPGIGELSSGSYYQDQTAATILRLLELDSKDFNPMAGAPIDAVFK